MTMMIMMIRVACGKWKRMTAITSFLLEWISNWILMTNYSWQIIQFSSERTLYTHAHTHRTHRKKCTHLHKLKQIIVRNCTHLFPRVHPRTHTLPSFLYLPNVAIQKSKTTNEKRHKYHDFCIISNVGFWIRVFFVVFIALSICISNAREKLLK